MSRTKRSVSISLIAMLALLSIATPAQATKIADVTRIFGARPNSLQGFGLVVGLKNTGDGGDYSPAIKPLVQMLGQLHNSATAAELASSGNVAVVLLSATVPPDGVRNGDKINVHVSTIGKATSLNGGRLVIAPMTGPIPNSGFYGFAEGAITIEDTAVPTGGVIKDGVTMEVDLRPQYVENGRFTLVIEDSAASWTLASTIAKVINGEVDDRNVGAAIAVAVDPKNVVVTIPEEERKRPDGFISRIQRLPITMLNTEARVQINEKTGTIVMTGDVEISPVVISHKGMTISTILPPPVPSARAPIVVTTDVIPVDTTNSGGAKLQDLVAAMDAIKVPAADRIEIVKELHKTGKLHAKLIME